MAVQCLHFILHESSPLCVLGSSLIPKNPLLAQYLLRLAKQMTRLDSTGYFHCSTIPSWRRSSSTSSTSSSPSPSISLVRSHCETRDLLMALRRLVVNFPVPITSVQGVLAKQAVLPCDITPMERDDAVFMVLWFREDVSEPLYRYVAGAFS